MTCEDFRNEIDNKADSRQAISPEDLPPQTRSHLDGCASCAQYLESVSTVDQILRNTQSVEIPSELYDTLLTIGYEQRPNSALASIRPMVIYILRILLPALALWIVALFMPAVTRVVVEMILMVFAMTLVFEKLGRRLVTDRV
ncbi:MAG: hypothetical protein M1469_09430 [Bacteroidetes bacterium]|nr:hypothetical protein [Bacteroidota bacterium]